MLRLHVASPNFGVPQIKDADIMWIWDVLKDFPLGSITCNNGAVRRSHTHVHIHIPIHIHRHTYVYIYIRTCIYIYIERDVCICVCVCICIILALQQLKVCTGPLFFMKCEHYLEMLVGIRWRLLGGL